MSSKARKRRQKQKAVDSQKLNLELKECQSSLEGEEAVLKSTKVFYS